MNSERVGGRDVIFRRMANRNQSDTNEMGMATTETKFQTDFYPAEKYQYVTKFLEDRIQLTDKIPRKYQEIWDRNAKYRFGRYWYFLGMPNFSLPIDITSRW